MQQPPMHERPSVAVVVVNYNSEAFIGEFCSSLSAVDYPIWRLVVVDSGSRDTSVTIIENAFRSAHVIRCDDNVGFAAGVNLGVQACLDGNDEFVLFLNPDTRVTPQFLSRLVDASDASTIVVPQLLYADDPALISTHAGGFDWRLGRFHDTYHGKPVGHETNVRRDDLETASFACALVPLQAFRDAGYVDEMFFMYYEETDWLRRARMHGYRIRYEPSSVVYHRESGSSGGGWMTPFKLYYATRNRPYLVRKNATSRLDFVVFTAYFLASRLAASVRMATRREWRLLRAMWRGVMDYYRGRMGRTVQVGDV
jgi:GT2 family glycosyltransferase